MNLLRLMTGLAGCSTGTQWDPFAIEGDLLLKLVEQPQVVFRRG